MKLPDFGYRRLLISAGHQDGALSDAFDIVAEWAFAADVTALALLSSAPVCQALADALPLKLRHEGEHSEEHARGAVIGDGLRPHVDQVEVDPACLEPVGSGE